MSSQHKSRQVTADVYDDEPRSRQQLSGGNGGWWAAVVAALVVGAIGGIIVGIQMGKGSSTTANTGAMGDDGQQMGGGFGMRGGTMGTVTAISSDSITVEDTRRSTEVTYTITSSTTVTDSGSSVTASDITVGDSVIVQSDSTSSSSDSDDATVKTATSIELNPTMPSGMPGGS